MVKYFFQLSKKRDSNIVLTVLKQSLPKKFLPSKKEEKFFKRAMIRFFSVN